MYHVSLKQWTLSAGKRNCLGEEKLKKINEIIEKSRNLIKKVIFKGRRSEKVQDIRRSTLGKRYIGEFLIKYMSGGEVD